jgi:hypothetical protein
MAWNETGGFVRKNTQTKPEPQRVVVNTPLQNWFLAVFTNNKSEYLDYISTELSEAFKRVFDRVREQTTKQDLWKIDKMSFGELLRVADNQGLIPKYFNECLEQIKSERKPLKLEFMGEQTKTFLMACCMKNQLEKENEIAEPQQHNYHDDYFEF